MGTLVTTAAHKSAAIAKLYAANVGWIKPEPGFRFLDSDGDEMIVIGWGGWRDFVSSGDVNINIGGKRQTWSLMEMKMMPPTLVGVNLYKGEWHLRSIPDMEMLDQCRPWPNLWPAQCEGMLCDCRDHHQHPSGCLNAAETSSLRCKGCDSTCDFRPE